jgi:hypothetical protein
MTRSVESVDHLEDFVDKLASLGYTVQEVRKRPQLYRINDELVNIRSRGKHKNSSYGRSFWYSVTFNVLTEIKWVIYLMTSSDYFVMLPSRFLEHLKERMYPDRSKKGVGVFDIDWDNEMLVLKEGELVSIAEYYHNLIDPDDFPQF